MVEAASTIGRVMRRLQAAAGGERRRDDEAARSSCAPPDARVAVLELQRTAGNHAVAGLVASLRASVAFTPMPGGSGAGAARVQRVMANVRFDSTKAPPIVETVSIERGSGTSGGAHATAFVVFVDTAINAVLNKPFEDAAQSLLSLCQEVKNLPGYQEPHRVVGGAAAKQKADDALALILANPDYQNLSAKSQLDWVPILQALIKDYLLLRNVAPGTYVPTAVKPSGMKGIGEKQEKEGADLMYEMRDDFSKQLEADPLTEPKDQGGRMTKAFAKGMWLTFDVGIVPERAIGEDVYAWLIRMTPPIAQHVLSCFAAYPEIESKQKSIQSAFLRNHVAKALPGLSAAKVKDSLVENVEEATGIGF